MNTNNTGAPAQNDGIEEGTYEYHRGKNTWVKIDDDGDLCRHIERPRKLLRIHYPGVAARSLPKMCVGPCCAQCEEDYRENISSSGPIWQNGAIPPSAIEEVAE